MAVVPCARLVRALLVGALVAVATVPLTPHAHAAPLTYYFHGTGTDDASRVQGTPTATFDTTAPGGTTGATQAGESAQVPTGPADPHEPYWIAPLSGSQPFWGTVRFSWYWSTANGSAAALGTSVDVAVYTDVDVAANTGTLLGSASESLFVSATPSLQTVTVNVTGTATRNLLIRAAGHFLDTSQGLVVHYDSTASPSSMAIDVGTQPPPPPAPTPAAPEDWTQVGSYVPPSIRANAVMVDDAHDGYTLLFAGQTPVPGASGLNDDTWEFDGTHWVQLSPPSSPPARTMAAGVYDVARQRVVVFGGFDGSGDFNDTWSWDGSTWTQLHPAHSPSARAGAGMAYDPASQADVLFGGSAVQNGNRVELGDTWVWNGSDWTQPLTSTAGPSPRWLFGFADGTGGLAPVLFGGFGPGETATGDTWTWNGTSQMWQPQAAVTAPAARIGESFAYDPAIAKDVLFAGFGNQSITTTGCGGLPACGFGSSVFDDTWTWDGSQWTQVAVTGSSPDSDSYAGMAFDPRNADILYFGGFGGGTGWQNDTWSFDGSAWTRRDLTAPDELGSPMLAREAGGDGALLFGGHDENGVASGQTWRWDGTGWKLLAPAHSPPPRLAGNLVFDAATRTTILFGGQVDTVSCDGAGCHLQSDYNANDTWSWDGVDWTRLNPATSPPARQLGSMTYDASTGQVVLFGGLGGTGVLGDTWTFDGATWTHRQPATSPPARFSAALDYDPATANAVLFGGTVFNQTYDGDTWTWDGSSWTQLQPAATPGQRAYHAMAYDPASSSMILFGGCTGCFGPGILADTWRWDGGTWTQLGTEHTPEGRAAAGVVDGTAASPLLLVAGQQQGNASFRSGTALLNDVWSFGMPVAPVQIPEAPVVPLLVLGGVGTWSMSRRRRRRPQRLSRMRA